MPDFWISHNGFVILKGFRMTPAKREDVKLCVAAFIDASREAGDLGRTTSQQAYELLYPDQVDYRTFLELWEHALAATPGSPVDASTGGTMPGSSDAPIDSDRGNLETGETGVSAEVMQNAALSPSIVAPEEKPVGTAAAPDATIERGPAD